MRPAIFLAQTALPEFHPAEVLFFKLAGLLVILLWIIYLIKEVFFAKADPRISDLVGSMGNTNVQLAVLNTNLAHLTDNAAQARAREQQMWDVINGVRTTLTSLAEDMGHLEGRTSTSIKPSPAHNSRPR